jgi:hypothetical protein
VGFTITSPVRYKKALLQRTIVETRLENRKRKTKRNKSEKLALLEALSHQGLVRYNDLAGVFDE